MEKYLKLILCIIRVCTYSCLKIERYQLGLLGEFKTGVKQSKKIFFYFSLDNNI